MKKAIRETQTLRAWL